MDLSATLIDLKLDVKIIKVRVVCVVQFCQIIVRSWVD